MEDLEVLIKKREYNVGQYYPFKDYRSGAKEASVKIKQAFDSGKKFVIVDAPTGSGKSGLAIEFAREFKTVVLTPTKLLQHQYANTAEFSLEYVVKGKSSYKCGLDMYKESTCDEAICCSDATASENAGDTPWEDAIKVAERPSQALKLRCTNAGICEYYGLINNIGKIPGAILNYDLFFHIKKRPGAKEGVDMGESLVMDEAHQLINKIKDIFGYKMSSSNAIKTLGQEGKRISGETAIAWLTRLCQVAQRQSLAELERKKASQIVKFLSRLEKLLSLDIANDKKFFIDDKDDEVEVKPLNMRDLKGLIFHPFKKVLFLSATFPPNFCDLLGIKEEEVARVVIKSSFNKSNRPIIVAQDMPILNYKTELTNNHPVVESIKKIIAKHKGQKGIIHCSNYKFFAQLKSNFEKNSRFIWVDQNEDKVSILEKHASTEKDTILVSPSMIEGVDLKDSLARFQIMMKLPFPPLDDYTKKLMTLYKDYYENAVATNICQAYGRAVRSESDYANFYIIDGAIKRILGNRKYFSRYFTEALEIINLDEYLNRKDAETTITNLT